MGNLCGQERQEATQIMQPKIKLDQMFGNLRIQVIQGEVLLEKANAFLNAAIEPYNTQLIKKIKEIKKQPLKNGVPQLIKFDQNNIDYIMMLKLCEDYDNDFNNQRKEGFLASFQLANQKNLKILSFTDPPQQLTQKTDEDYYIELFLSSLWKHKRTSQDCKIEQIKLINLDVKLQTTYCQAIHKYVEKLKNNKQEEDDQKQIVQKEVETEQQLDTQIEVQKFKKKFLYHHKNLQIILPYQEFKLFFKVYNCFKVQVYTDYKLMITKIYETTN